MGDKGIFRPARLLKEHSHLPHPPQPAMNESFPPDCFKDVFLKEWFMSFVHEMDHVVMLNVGGIILITTCVCNILKKYEMREPHDVGFKPVCFFF